MRATAEEARTDIRLGLWDHIRVAKFDPRRVCVFCGRDFGYGDWFYKGTSELVPKKYHPSGSHKYWCACNECFEKVKL